MEAIAIAKELNSQFLEDEKAYGEQLLTGRVMGVVDLLNSPASENLRRVPVAEWSEGPLDIKRLSDKTTGFLSVLYKTLEPELDVVTPDLCKYTTTLEGYTMEVQQHPNMHFPGHKDIKIDLVRQANK